MTCTSLPKDEQVTDGDPVKLRRRLGRSFTTAVEVCIVDMTIGRCRPTPWWRSWPAATW